MVYYTEEQRQRGIETRRRNLQYKKYRESPEDYYDIYGYKHIPKVMEKPNPNDYGIDDNTEMKLKHIDEEFIANRQEIRSNVIIAIAVLGAFIATAYLMIGGSIGNVIATLIIIPMFGWFPLMLFWDKGMTPPKTYLHSQFDEYKRQLSYYDYWQRRQEKNHWNRMSGIKFEREVATMFRDIGFDAKVTKSSGDGGVDVILTKDDRKIAVQCKRYNKPVGPHVIRDLLGTMHYLDYQEGAIVTTTGFTSGVKDFADKSGNIHLIDLNDIVKGINNPRHLLEIMST